MEEHEPLVGQKQSSLSTRITWAVCLVATCVSVSLLQEQPVQIHDKPERSSLGRRPISLGRAPTLVSYGEFRRSLMRAERDQMGALEHSLRSALFNANLCEIGQHNMAAIVGLETYYIEQSPFRSDLTPSEQTQLDRKLGGLHQTAHLDAPVSNPLKGLFGPKEPRKRPDYPLEADHTGCLGAIRHQKHCGACYAFSLMALLEWHRCMQSAERQPVDFSEQFLIDCGDKSGLGGCLEGRLTAAKNFVNFFGLKWEKDHPYRAEASPKVCKTNNFMERDTVRLKISQWRRIPVEREVFERTLREQPILLEANLPENIRSYSRGIHPGHNCKETISHGILLVGFGHQDGEPFWLLRNSYGDRWGDEGGYLRMSRNMPSMPKCFPSAFVANFKFSDMPETAADEFYTQFEYQPPKEPERVPTSGLMRSMLANEFSSA